MSRNRDDYFGDVVYEVWRSGGNPDAVDRDCTDECFYDRREPDECARDELRRQQPREVADAPLEDDGYREWRRPWPNNGF